MNGGAILAEGLSVPLALDYVDRNRTRAIHKVFVNKILERMTKGGKPRIDILCRIPSESPKPSVKTFLSHRIISATDLETGEIHDDTNALFAGIIRSAGGVPPSNWPDEPFRTRDIDIEFVNGFADGWFFGVFAAFRPALDIVMETVKLKDHPPERCWTRGFPPAFKFDVGDMLHAPAANRTVGRTAVQIQVREATPDKTDGRAIVPGIVVADIWDFIDGNIRNKRQITLTQSEFADLLRTGSAEGVCLIPLLDSLSDSV